MYCSKCGKKLENNVSYCSHCGTLINFTRNVNYSTNQTIETLPISCIFSYLPFLFWLPLIVKRKDKLYRKCANQGLWITILFIVFSTIIMFLKCNNIINFEEFKNLFEYWSYYKTLYKVKMIFLYQFIIGTAMYIPINSTHGFLKGFSSKVPHELALWGKFEIIKEEYNADDIIIK